ncbi:hypothetical protein KUV75_04065 [Qipengyuania gaetbuli]|uniref:hypothetical protein n=1 Tax=Qipengyuania gaetbuli TaxID=266952 RepID=UPI001C99741F|nr:hypothetical protein [Qipengyuania gaetbuli]MBY6014076.1 hypothetical protein [Qipengyuania gaetbuli]
MIDEAILAAVPESLRAEYKADVVYRIGMLLFRRGQPGIVAHLVETGAMAPAVQNLAMSNPIGTGIQIAGQIAGQAIQAKQNKKIIAGIETLQTMGLSNLALTGVGIGATLVSHALLSARLDRIQNSVESMQDTLDRISRKLEALEREAIQRDLLALQSACERAEDGLEEKSNRLLEKASEELRSLQRIFYSHAQVLRNTQRFDEMEPFVDAYALAGSTRITCNIALDNLPRAIKAAEQFGMNLSVLVEPVGLADLIAEKAAQAVLRSGTPQYVVAFESLREQAALRRSSYLERSQVALSAPHTLQQIQLLGVSGQAFLERVRSETEQPVLLLMGSKQKD